MEQTLESKLNSFNMNSNNISVSNFIKKTYFMNKTYQCSVVFRITLKYHQYMND